MKECRGHLEKVVFDRNIKEVYDDIFASISEIQNLPHQAI